MTRPPRGLLSCAALSAALVLAAAPARASASPEARAQAANFFDAGAQAYEAGQYVVAAEAFLKAHALVPSAALLFSAAQAYRRQYVLDSSPSTLRRAIALYRDYLGADPKPPRREDAVKALEALVPLEPRPAAAPAAPEASATPASPTAPPTSGARLLLSARNEDAEVSVDDGPFLRTPVVVKVAPGPRRVKVRAPGYHDEELTVSALPDDLTPRHVVLRPKPAKLRVTGISGARVVLDGTVRATVPTLEPLAIEPGAHFVAVTLSGHKPYGKQLDLGRDTSIDLVAALPVTPRRIAALSILSAGAAGAIVSGVLTGVALTHQREAVGLRDQRAAAPLLPDARDRYNRAVEVRDDFARAAAITGGAAALTLATGALLFAFDDPEVLPPSGEPRKAPSEPTPRADFTVGILSVGVRVAF